MFSPWPLLIAVVLFAAGGFGGWKAAMDHRDALELADARGRADALEAVATELAKVKVIQKNVTNILEKETKTNTVYAECRHTPEALKALNSALVPGGVK
jgi:hypothetical protein